MKPTNLMNSMKDDERTEKVEEAIAGEYIQV